MIEVKEEAEVLRKKGGMIEFRREGDDLLLRVNVVEKREIRNSVLAIPGEGLCGVGMLNGYSERK